VVHRCFITCGYLPFWEQAYCCSRMLIPQHISFFCSALAAAQNMGRDPLWPDQQWFEWPTVCLAILFQVEDWENVVWEIKLLGQLRPWLIVTEHLSKECFETVFCLSQGSERTGCKCHFFIVQGSVVRDVYFSCYHA